MLRRRGLTRPRLRATIRSVNRPHFVPRSREERADEDVDEATVVKLIRSAGEEEARCKSACAEEADVVSQTWLHHTELFG